MRNVPDSVASTARVAIDDDCDPRCRWYDVLVTVKSPTRANRASGKLSAFREGQTHAF